MQRTMPTTPRMADRRILMIALALGAVAAGLTVAMLASTPAAMLDEGSRSVVVTRRAIEAGQPIGADDIALRELPTSAVVADAFVGLDQVLGQKARYPLAAGAQIGAAGVVASVAVQALSFQIPQGQRGFTIPVEENNSPAGVVAPGDFVDVLVAAPAKSLVVPATAGRADSTPVLLGSLDRDEEAEAVVTLLQNVQVLSVQRTYVENGVTYDPSVRGNAPEGNVSHVTLSLTPDQSQLMWLASQKGKVTVTLRAFGDNASTDALRPVIGPGR